MSGQFDDARQGARRLHHASVPASAERVPSMQAHDEIQALVQNARKRARRIERERRQYRDDLFIEILAEPCLLLVIPLVALDETDASFGQLREHDLVKQLVLLAHEVRDFV